MRKSDVKSIFVCLLLAMVLAVISISSFPAAAADGAAAKAVSFGGPGADQYNCVAALPDGFVAVGYSEYDSFEGGDWTGVPGKGETDAVIMKYDAEGGIIWSRSFGGSGNDVFNSVTAVPGGFIAVGYSDASSFGGGDWTGVLPKGRTDAVAVKYDHEGEVVWKRTFGGSGNDSYSSAAAVPGGFIAVGYSQSYSFYNGDWRGMAGKGGYDAIAVKYDQEGEVVWKKAFGGPGTDYLYSVAVVPDGFVAVGYSDHDSFGSGDWAGFSRRGDVDAIAVKYSEDGGILWKDNFGGPGTDYFHSVTALPDGFAAAGYSTEFGEGDWEGVPGKGGADAVIVKYDAEGTIVWKKEFGGTSPDYFTSAAAVPDGLVAVGYSSLPSSGDGDWTGERGNGYYDATAVKYSDDGEIVWKKNFGGVGGDYFFSAAEVSGRITAVGRSDSGGWMNIEEKGSSDAIMIMSAEAGTGGADDGSVWGLTAVLAAAAAVLCIAAAYLIIRKNRDPPARV